MFRPPGAHAFVALLALLPLWGGCSSSNPSPGLADAESSVPVADAGAPSGDDAQGSGWDTGLADALTDVTAERDVAGGEAGDDGSTGLGSGLDAFCAHYKECGGTYYQTAQDCVNAGLAYWGSCRLPLLDAFGNCMVMIPCSQWSPDGYIPQNTPCATQWQALMSSPACK